MLYELHKSYLVVGMVAMPAGVILGITSPKPGTVVEASLVSELKTETEHAEYDLSPTDNELLS